MQDCEYIYVTLLLDSTEPETMCFCFSFEMGLAQLRKPLHVNPFILEYLIKK